MIKRVIWIDAESELQNNYIYIYINAEVDINLEIVLFFATGHLYYTDESSICACTKHFREKVM